MRSLGSFGFMDQDDEVDRMIDLLRSRDET
jgi:hypothetical protein